LALRRLADLALRDVDDVRTVDDFWVGHARSVHVDHLAPTWRVVGREGAVPLLPPG